VATAKNGSGTNGKLKGAARIFKKNLGGELTSEKPEYQKSMNEKHPENPVTPF